MKWLVFEKTGRKTLEKALLIYKGKEDELRLHLRREHLFGYDINKKEVKSPMTNMAFTSLLFIYIFYLTNRVLAAVSFLMTAEVPIL